MSQTTIHSRAIVLTFSLVFTSIAGSLPKQPRVSGAKVEGAGEAKLAPPSARMSKEQARKAYGRLGVSFEANRGQWDERVRFVARSGGQTTFLTHDAAWFVLTAPVERNTGATQGRDGATSASALAMQDGESAAALTGRARSAMTNEPRRMHGVRMVIEGANARAEIVGENELEGRVNYFRGKDPSQWQTDVPTYGAVRYRGIYAGVDLVYYGNARGEMEYDFVVAPGVDASEVALRFEGADSLQVDASGDLVIGTSAGELRQRRPVVYQELNGERQEIASRYVTRGRGRVGFEVAEYDATRPLIIDPVLVYSTYLGGSANDQGKGIAVDSAGNAYITGYTASTNFPTTAGAFDTTSNGNFDAFVTKLNADGSALVYSTYLGGSASDRSNGIALDSTGNAYVTGSTASSNFPTTSGAFDTTLGGSADVFVTKLNAAGSALVYSTYLGGGGSDGGAGIAVDSSGNAYVTGSAGSNTFPTTAGAFLTFLNSAFNAFVTKVNATGSALVYSTLLGGDNQADAGAGIAVDSAGHAYVTGTTLSTDFPTTPGAFDSTFNSVDSSDADAFMTKVNAAGSALVYSTYLGGNESDEGAGIAVDSDGNAYVTGTTDSPNFPTANPIQGTLRNPNFERKDVFVTKINVAGSSLVYSTYLGSGSNDEGRGIAVDSAGNVDITGYALGSDFPIANAIQGTSGGSRDVFVTKINAAGSALVYSTYLGGNHEDEGNGIALDSAGNAYVTGRAPSTNFPTTLGAFDTTSNGSDDPFVTKIDETTTIPTPTPTPTPPPSPLPSPNDECYLDPSFVDAKVELQPVPISGYQEIFDVAQQPDDRLVVLGITGSSTVVARYLVGGQLDSSFGTGGTVILPLLPLGRPQALALQADGKIILAGSGMGFGASFVLMRINGDGATDTSFGTNGVASNQISANPGDIFLSDIALQPAGKIVAVGDNGSPTNPVTGLVRYNPDGQLDQSFGVGGIVTTGFTANISGDALALQSDAKIVVVGGVFQLAQGEDTEDDEWAVARFNENGSLDTSFDGDGKTFVSFGLGDAAPRDVVVQPDGKIVIAGYTFTNAANLPKNAALARLNTDGSLDTSFDSDGKVLTDAGGYSQINRIALQSDGKIVAGGGRNLYTGKDDFLAMRYQTNGALDVSFGTDGIVSTDFFGLRDEANALVIQADGRIVAAGLVTTPNTGRDFGLARYLSDGQPDAAFGTVGRVTAALTSVTGLSGNVVQPDGKILVGGTVGGVFLLARFNADGSPDTSFGTGGIVTTAFDNFLGPITPPDEDAQIRFATLVSIRLMPDGRIVAAGKWDNPCEDVYMLLARYNADGSLDTTFGGDGQVERKLRDSSFSLCDTSEGLTDAFVQSDGSIIASYFVRPGVYESSLIRFNADGSIDAAYGGSFQDVRGFSSLLFQPDGKILSLGDPIGSSNSGDFLLMRFDSGGKPDSTFGAGGKVFTDFGANEDATNFVVQPDGKIVVAGISSPNSGSPGTFNLALARYNPDGSLDATFGTGGKVLTDFGVDEIANSLALLPDGKLLVGGSNRSGSVSNGLLVRYNADGSLDTTFGCAGRLVNAGGIVIRHIQADGRVVVNSNGTLLRYLSNPIPNCTTACATPTPTPTPMTIQFSLSSYSVNEADGRVDTVVTRSGDTSGAASVSFATGDLAGAQNCHVLNGEASSRCDYEIRLKTVRFAPGENSKTVSVFIINDSYLEGTETFTVSLTNPGGAALGTPSTATLTITDNDLADAPNPINTTPFYVRMHYLDFLNREAETAGFNFWSNEIESCGADAQCREVKRINVSAAFYLSIEFQQTGYLVIRAYKTAYGDGSGMSSIGGTPHSIAIPIIRLSEFLLDTQEIGDGVIVGQTGWEQLLENKKQAFFSEFVQRPRFTTAFPTAMAPAQFVDTLFANAGVTPSATDRNAAINEFGTATNTVDIDARGRAVRRVAENSTLAQQEFNRAFVLMQYFGYLRRNPNDFQDSDYSGYDFWLTKLNNFNGDYIKAEMVKAFISSIEYHQRFGP